jgi:hypothetical protein
MAERSCGMTILKWLRSTSHGVPGGLLFLWMLALAGCATPDSLRPGMSVSEVIDRVGRPAEEYAMPGMPPVRRLAYPGGGLDQQTWMVDVDANGRVLAVKQVISMEHFAQINVDKDDTTTIRREFGPPWRIQPYALSGLTAWQYPYLESNWWNLMMSVHFDAAGIVRKTENGNDPRFLGGSDRQ